MQSMSSHLQRLGNVRAAIRTILLSRSGSGTTWQFPNRPHLQSPIRHEPSAVAGPRSLCGVQLKSLRFHLHLKRRRCAKHVGYVLSYVPACFSCILPRMSPELSSCPRTTHRVPIASFAYVSTTTSNKQSTHHNTFSLDGCHVLRISCPGTRLGNADSTIV